MRGSTYIKKLHRNEFQKVRRDRPDVFSKIFNLQNLSLNKRKSVFFGWMFKMALRQYTLKLLEGICLSSLLLPLIYFRADLVEVSFTLMSRVVLSKPASESALSLRVGF